MRSTDRSLHGRVAFPVNDLPPENPAVVTRILVSACLTGQPVRYNGDSRLLTHPLLSRWQAEGRLVRVCPELDVGFPVPRPPAEIVGGTGDDVLAGRARVVTITGDDVTAAFLAAADATLATARQHGCRLALLTEGSPSCGRHRIYDGSFTGASRPGTGVTVARLRAAGIEVYAETGIGALAAAIDWADAGRSDGRHQ